MSRPRYMQDPRPPWPGWLDYLLMVLMVAAAISSLLLTGCGSLDEVYVRADRATYDALSPAITRWVASDTTLTETMAEDYGALMYSWERRIDAAEELLEADE